MRTVASARPRERKGRQRSGMQRTCPSTMRGSTQRRYCAALICFSARGMAATGSDIVGRTRARQARFAGPRPIDADVTPRRRAFALRLTTGESSVPCATWPTRSRRSAAAPSSATTPTTAVCLVRRCPPLTRLIAGADEEERPRERKEPAREGAFRRVVRAARLTCVCLQSALPIAFRRSVHAASRRRARARSLMKSAARARR